MRYFLQSNRHFLSVFYLLLATFLWGSSAVTIKETLVQVPASAMMFIRFTIAFLFFLPLVGKEMFRRDKVLWLGSIETSFWGFVGYASQTISLEYTSVNRNAFISTLYVVILPLWLGILGRRIPRHLLVAVLVAVVGVTLLSYDGSRPNLGDFWSLITALSWVICIWRLEAYAHRLSPLAFTGVQSFIAAIFGLLWCWGSDRQWVSVQSPLWQADLPWMSLLYLGIGATAIAHWLQNIGQAKVNAVEAALIYPLEPVWATLLAWLLLQETMGLQGIIGAILMSIATLTTLFPSKNPSTS